MSDEKDSKARAVAAAIHRILFAAPQAHDDEPARDIVCSACGRAMDRDQFLRKSDCPERPGGHKWILG